MDEAQTAEPEAVPRTDTPAAPWRGLGWRVWTALALLAMLAFAMAWRQGSRTFNLGDFGYVLENCHRLNSGETPYRDFFLCLPPLHFWIQSVLLRLGGGYAVSLVLFAALMQALLLVQTFLLCELIESNPWRSLVCSALVTMGGVAVLGHPFYDIDAGWIFTSCMLLLLIWERHDYAWPLGLATGYCAGLVVLTKLNMGLPLIVGLLLALGAAVLLFKASPRKLILSPLLGILLCLGLFALWLSLNGAASNFVEQVWLFPARVRLKFWEHLSASLSLIGLAQCFVRPFDHYSWWRVLIMLGVVLSLVNWPARDRNRPLMLLLLWPIMAFALGAMQSQRYWSVFGIYPVAAVILCQTHRWLSRFRPRIAGAVVLLLAGGFLLTAATANYYCERLSFLRNAGMAPAPFRIEKLKGLAVTEQYRNSFEELVEATNPLIPKDEPVFYIPGDLPFYYASGRHCPLPSFYVLEHAGCSLETCLADLEKARVPWLIVRAFPEQMPGFPLLYNTPGLPERLREHYNEVGTTRKFMIYKRKP